MAQTSTSSSYYPLNETHQIPARSSVAVPLQAGQQIKVINTHGSQVVDFWALVLPPTATPPPEPDQALNAKAEAARGGDQPTSPTSTATSTTTTQQDPPSPSSSPSSSPVTTPGYLSMSHTRASTQHASPLINDILVTNQRTPILRLTADSSPGIHDTLIAACDVWRYWQLGVPAHQRHDNCTDNFARAVRRYQEWKGGLLSAAPSSSSPAAGAVWDSRPTPPDPLNLFMNIPVDERDGHGHGGGGVAVEAGNDNKIAGGNIRFEKPVCKKGDFVVFEALLDCLVVMSACPQDLVRVNDMMPTEAHFVVS